MWKATTVIIILLPEVIEVPSESVGSEKLVPERPMGFCLTDVVMVMFCRFKVLLAHVWTVFLLDRL